jgi:hypothetical protein
LETSRISGFYKLTPGERLKAVAERSELSEGEMSQIEEGLSGEQDG